MAKRKKSETWTESLKMKPVKVKLEAKTYQIVYQRGKRPTAKKR